MLEEYIKNSIINEVGECDLVVSAEFKNQEIRFFFEQPLKQDPKSDFFEPEDENVAYCSTAGIALIETGFSENVEFSLSFKHENEITKNQANEWSNSFITIFEKFFELREIKKSNNLLENIGQPIILKDISLPMFERMDDILVTDLYTLESKYFNFDGKDIRRLRLVSLFRNESEYLIKKGLNHNSLHKFPTFLEDPLRERSKL